MAKEQYLKQNYLKKRGFEEVALIQVDLRECYMMQCHARSVDYFMFRKGRPDRHMTQSPHVKLARLYLDKGEKWFRKNFYDTEYCYLREHYANKPRRPPGNFINLFKSIQQGYRRKGYNNHIHVLDEPFCNTRYGFKEPNLVPEIYAGNHRVGILIALGKYNVEVLLLKDIGSKVAPPEISGPVCRSVYFADLMNKERLDELENSII